MARGRMTLKREQRLSQSGQKAPVRIPELDMKVWMYISQGEIRTQVLGHHMDTGSTWAHTALLLFKMSFIGLLPTASTWGYLRKSPLLGWSLRGRFGSNWWTSLYFFPVLFSPTEYSLRWWSSFLWAFADARQLSYQTLVLTLGGSWQL